ncbi:nucleotide exchange factor GrpE [Sphingopyxis sp. XHP0097]|jgi:molecular chaperone GrpE|uniref:Protein GrpE n=1 Tax=Sphingopyxis jiangsuensis TaxID=2871171 RepID=A0ABS7MAH7_9SPHN|nr:MULTISPECIES: nucleotide exchange factor GrpE [Sphingopyxis]MBL0768306.1 nucleotide exchange factor GrpE [Sphingopyxis lutea]MBY4635979.1 nucleotide exchange factor GrpE [Sphingopyxis jiangsuensis]
MTNTENDTPVEDGATEDTEAAEAVAAEPQDEAADAAEQIAALQQDLLYARAETQNVTRRKDKEIADAHAYAATKFARDILSVADNLGRALASLGEEQRANEAIKPLVTGLEATERELMSVFERHGITRIAAIGLPLDPNQHQAMLEIPSDKEPGTIVQEMQAGYMMKDRLLRPAMVGVAKKPD